MARYTKTTVSSGFLSNEGINANFTDIETAINDTLSRKGDAPNTMEADIDMDSNKVINLAAPTAGGDAVSKTFGDANYGGTAATGAAASAAAAAVSETNAASSETNAASSAAAAATSEANASTSETNAANSASVGFASAGAFDYGLVTDLATVFDSDYGSVAVAATVFSGIGLSAPGAIAIDDAQTAPTTVAGKAIMYVDTADGDLKVKFGDGTVKTLATDT